jgi:glucose-1-phosphate thymidylyltransferase
MDKGIILAGGSGTRLYPLTISVSKQLLPVYNKPMIYYPLTTLMLAGVRDILIITTPNDQHSFINLLGDGSSWGINISYKVQPSPDGLAQAFIIGKDFISSQPCALILGDNLFYGNNLQEKLKSYSPSGATIFGYYVKDPTQYGVVEIKNNKILSIEEKPKNPKSNIAVTGLYFYDNTVVDRTLELKPSARAELEITDLNRLYLKDNLLNLQILGRGFAWLDTGNPNDLVKASQYIQAIEERQSLMVACPEEIAYNLGYITSDNILEKASKYGKTDYAEYLRKLIES